MGVARGYFLGSLATGSTHRLLAKALVRLAPAELEMRRLHSRTCRPTIVTTMTTPRGGEEARGRRNSIRNYMTEFHAFIMRVDTVLPRNA